MVLKEQRITRPESSHQGSPNWLNLTTWGPTTKMANNEKGCTCELWVLPGPQNQTCPPSQIPYNRSKAHSRDSTNKTQRERKSFAFRVWQIGFFSAAVPVDWWRWWARQRRPSWAIWRARWTMEEEGLGSTSAWSGSSRYGALRRFWSTGYRFSTTPKSDPASAQMVSFELLCWSVEMGLCGFGAWEFDLNWAWTRIGLDSEIVWIP